MSRLLSGKYHPSLKERRRSTDIFPSGESEVNKLRAIVCESWLT